MRKAWIVQGVLAAGGVALAGWILAQGRPAPVPPLELLTGFQDAAAPLELPGDGSPRMRWHFLDPWQRATVPLAVRWDEPMGSESGAGTYNAQKYWDMNEPRGGHHLGDDLNGIGGMNSDLGDPIFAPADGKVVYAGEPGPGWGNVVILAHRLASGEMRQTMHAHLDRIEVTVGMPVARGRRIGTNGTAGGRYPAHLHFELRISEGVDIGGGYGMDPLNRINPLEWIQQVRSGKEADLSPSPLVVALRPGEDHWSGLEVLGAEKLGEILSRGEEGGGEK